jgi:glycosyltransferase involved in cell wall biosynthesis
MNPDESLISRSDHPSTSSSMKVLYLNPSGQLGGAERMLLDVLASLRTVEPEWSLHLIASDEGPLFPHAEALGVNTSVVRFPTALARIGDAGAGGNAGKQTSRLALFFKLLRAVPGLVTYVRKLRRIIQELNPDLLHTNGFKMHLLGVWATPSSVPVIWHIHDYVSLRPLMARLLRRYSQRCAVAIANSRSVAEDVKKVCGAGLKVLTVYNGIDVDQFSPTGPKLDLDALSGFAPAPAETVRVGILATLARWKGHQTFLHAMSLLPSTLPIRAYVMSGALYRTNGSQYSLEELKTLADKLGLANRVGFTGFLAEPARAMRALDIVVHASTQPEPFGLVIAEGMACGRAVIVSETGGAAELFEPEINALGHPPGDAKRLAERITLLATDQNLRARLGAAGRITAEQRFDRTRLAAELTPIYRAALGATNVSESVISNSSERLPLAVSEFPLAEPDAIRVLHVHSGNIYGGVESMLLTQVRERDLCPAIKTSFALCFAGQFSEEVAATGTPIHCLGEVRIRQPLTVRRARRKLRELLRQQPFDVVVTHSCWSQAIFGPVARAEAVALVFYLHSPTDGRHWLERWARRTSPDAALCNSRFTAETLPELYPRVRAVILYCPVAPPHLSYSETDAARTRAELQTPLDATVIIQVSRLESWKGHALHLEALGQLKDLPGWVCWQIGGAQKPGEEKYLQELKELAAKLGIGERVHFLEQRSDVSKLLAAADIFCQPNTGPEPFGIVFIEALYARLPVVTTALGGAREIVDDSCGVLVPPGDARALAEALRRLIQERALRKRLGMGGPARALTLCDPSSQMTRFHEVLSGVIYQRQVNG